MAGNTISKNVVEDVYNANFEFLNDTIQSCKETTIAINEIIAENITGGITIKDINQENSVVVKTQCLLMSKSDVTISNDLNQKINNIAQATTEPLSSFDSTEAINITTNIKNFNTVIQEKLYQECYFLNKAANSLKFRNVEGQVIVEAVNQKNQINATQDCILNNQAVVNSANTLQESIDNSAVATKTGLLNSTTLIIIAVIIFAIIILIVVINLTKKKSS